MNLRNNQQTYKPILELCPEVPPPPSPPRRVPQPPYHSCWRQSIVNRYCHNILYSERLSNKFRFEAFLSICHKKGSKYLFLSGINKIDNHNKKAT